MRIPEFPGVDIDQLYAAHDFAAAIWNEDATIRAEMSQNSKESRTPGFIQTARVHPVQLYKLLALDATVPTTSTACLAVPK